jgi:CcmD family protein
MTEWRFVIAAYAVTWVVIIGYSVHLVRTMRRSRDLLRTARDEAARAGGDLS